MVKGPYPSELGRLSTGGSHGHGWTHLTLVKSQSWSYISKFDILGNIIICTLVESEEKIVTALLVVH